MQTSIGISSIQAIYGIRHIRRRSPDVELHKQKSAERKHRKPNQILQEWGSPGVAVIDFSAGVHVRSVGGTWITTRKAGCVNRDFPFDFMFWVSCGIGGSKRIEICSVLRCNSSFVCSGEVLSNLSLIRLSRQIGRRWPACIRGVSSPQGTGRAGRNRPAADPLNVTNRPPLPSM